MGVISIWMVFEFMNMDEVIQKGFLDRVLTQETKGLFKFKEKQKILEWKRHSHLQLMVYS